MINETHARELTSWAPGAEKPGGDFPIQNLPFGAFVPNQSDVVSLGVAIGDCVLDLRAASERGLIDGVSELVTVACQGTTLNGLMALGPKHWHALRLTLSRLLRSDSTGQADAQTCLHRQDSIRMVMPANVGDYTDFYTSIHHATKAGRIFRPDNPLFPNFEHLPVGYHGRASSVVVSGHSCRRPWGQSRRAIDSELVFSPTNKLDFELELAIFAGPGNRLGEAIPIGAAEEHIFGMCLLNDWSARDIQAWEYQPLGPFLGKSFMTSISPWVVTMEALAPFRQAMENNPGRPEVPKYLSDPELDLCNALDIQVEVALETASMRLKGIGPNVIGKANFVEQYWSVFQMLTHHASNGCNIRPGDLLGTGTISGTELGEEGCLLEKTLNGSRPLNLPGGETRSFLEDGDEVVMRAHCARDGFASIGFGECRGRIEQAAASAGWLA